jgi:hypothetical protein
MRVFRDERIDLTEDNVEACIQKLISMTNLKQLDRLQRSVDYDIDTVRNKDNSGPDAVNILKKLSENNLASKQIAEAFDQGTSANLVGTVLNDLSNVEEDREGDQTKCPIAQKRSNNQWELTNYGKVLCHQLFERDFSDGWIFRYAVDSESLSQHQYKIISNSLEEMNEYCKTEI